MTFSGFVYLIFADFLSILQVHLLSYFLLYKYVKPSSDFNFQQEKLMKLISSNKLLYKRYYY